MTINTFIGSEIYSVLLRTSIFEHCRQGSKLQISELKDVDLGAYRCQASNALGSFSSPETHILGEKYFMRQWQFVNSFSLFSAFYIKISWKIMLLLVLQDKMMELNAPFTEI